MTIKLGSLFDGSGGFPLAGALCGIEPIWAAEVEPYPIAVTRERFDGSEDSPLKKLLKHHYPNLKLYMKHLGDVSKINGAEIEPVDIITFGSPCQDLSVAGLRKGLKHEAMGDEETTRSGLFMEAVRIIKEMREATNGVYPRLALWENVPGAFSSNKGEDFKAVCEELIKIVEPSASMPSVPQRGWAYADSYIGDGWSLAYRVFDAQYWGVPQRRRRIYLVIDFGGTSAQEVLFERDGLRGYFAEGRAPWQATPPEAEGGSLAEDRAGAAAGDRGRQLDAVAYTMVVRNGRETDSSGRSAGKGALIQTERASTINTVQDQYLFQPTAFSFDPLSSNSMKSKNPHSGCREVEVSRTIDTTDPNPSKNQGGLAIVEALADETVYCLQGNGIDRADTAGCNGKGVKEDICYTLNTIDRPAVAYGVDCRNFVETVEMYPTLQAKPNGGQSLNYSGAVRVRYIVRRLTPTECARLQGFADWWGHLEHKSDFTEGDLSFWIDVRNTHAAINGKAVKDYNKTQMLTWYNKLWSDGAEYKLWGNGVAFPCALYCMQGIAEVLNREEDDSWMN